MDRFVTTTGGDAEDVATPPPAAAATVVTTPAEEMEEAAPEVNGATLYGSLVMDPKTFFQSVRGQGCALIKVATRADARLATSQLQRFADQQDALTGTKLVCVLIDVTGTYFAPLALLVHPIKRTFANLQPIFDKKLYEHVQSNLRIAKDLIPPKFNGSWSNFACAQKLRVGERGVDRSAVSFLQHLHYWMHKLLEKPPSFWLAPQDAFKRKKSARTTSSETPKPSPDAPYVQLEDIVEMQKAFSGFDQGSIFEADLFAGLPGGTRKTAHSVGKSAFASMDWGVVRSETRVPLSLFRRKQDDLFKFTILDNDPAPNNKHIFKAATYVRAEMVAALDTAMGERSRLLEKMDTQATHLAFMTGLYECYMQRHATAMDTLEAKTYTIVALQENRSDNGDGTAAYVAFVREHDDTPICPVNLRSVVSASIHGHQNVLEPLRKAKSGYTFYFADTPGAAIGTAVIENAKRNKLTLSIADREVYTWGVGIDLYEQTSLVQAEERAMPGPTHRAEIDYTNAPDKGLVATERAFLSQIKDLNQLGEGCVHRITAFGFAKFKGARLYVQLGEHGHFWLPLDTPAYRSNDTHELIPKEGEKRKKPQAPEYWTNMLAEPMMLRLVKVNFKSVHTPDSGVVKIPTTCTAAILRVGDWHLHHHAETLSKTEGRVLDKSKRADAPEASFVSGGIRFVHEQELSVSGKARKGAVMRALIKSRASGTVYVFKDIRHARELSAAAGVAFNVREWRME